LYDPQQMRLLMVEDDPDIRLLFTTVLSGRGFEVVTAAHGAQALELLQSGDPRPSVIVADLHMPVMDGWQLLTALRADPELSSIPVIVLTAADDPQRAAPRPETILLKPISIEALIAAISAELAQRACPRATAPPGAGSGSA
jgi:CheY-like chemotaxis protein